MYPPQTAYDRAITIFSPEGRLLQVSYAKEAVRMGATALGLVYKQGVILAARKDIDNNLIIPDSLEKIYMVEDNIGITIAGLIADARRLVDIAREKAQSHKFVFNETISLEGLSKYLGNVMQYYTQYGGVRPFGVSLLIGGVDPKPALFEADPSGMVIQYKAKAIGAGEKEVEKFFLEHYVENVEKEKALDLAIKALKREKEMKAEELDVAIIDENGMRILTTEEKNSFIHRKD